MPSPPKKCFTFDSKVDDFAQILADAVGHDAEISPALLGARVHQDQGAVAGPEPLAGIVDVEGGGGVNFSKFSRNRG